MAGQGRPDYQALAAVLPSESLLLVADDEVAPILANGSENITVYSPAGTHSRVLAAWCNIPPPVGATAGTHIAYLQLGNIQLATGESAFGAAIQYVNGWWQAATVTGQPGAPGDQSWLLGVAQFDASQAWDFGYTNNTNATQDGTRNYHLMVLEVDEP